MITKKEAIMNLLDELDDEVLVDIYNRLAEKHHYEPIYPLYMLDDLYSTEGKSVVDILDELELVKYTDAYVSMSESSGYWVSFDYYANSPNCCSNRELATYIIDYEDACNSDEIQDVLDAKTLGDVLDWEFATGDRVEIRGLGIKTAIEWLKTLSAEEKDYLVSHFETDEDNYIELV